jgi:hypothetical protein
MKKTLILTLLFLISCLGTERKLCSPALAKEPGTTGATFLKIGQGARPVAMGGAFSAVADDVNAVWWNPAGLANLSQKEFTATQSQWFADITHQSLGYAQNWGEKSALGGSLIYLGTTDRGRSEWGEDLGSFDIKDLAFSLLFARKMSERISLGIGLKYISQELYEEKASGYAFDLGGLYQVSENLTYGLSLQNIGEEIKFIEEGDPLPLSLKLGAAYKLPEKDLTLALDLNLPSYEEIRINVGLEYWYKELLALRGGWKSGYDLGEMSLGLGFKFRSFLLDYAYVPYGDLGDTQRFSLTLRFGSL